MGLLLIFIAKVVEVSLTTLRMVFVSRGEKIYASSIGFVEVMIWLKVASVVLVDINEHPAKMFIYALGFAAGSYVGLALEEKIGLGYSAIQVITDYDDGEELTHLLREDGRAVTVSEGKGRDSKKAILLIYVKRKNKNEFLKELESKGIKGVITVSEAQKVYGGFGITR